MKTDDEVKHLQQRVEGGFLIDGLFVTESTNESVVTPANRSRIVRRERPRSGHWDDGWFYFATYPDLGPEFADYVTRIRWLPIQSGGAMTWRGPVFDEHGRRVYGGQEYDSSRDRDYNPKLDPFSFEYGQHDDDD